MEILISGEILRTVGIVIMSASACLAAVAAVVFHANGKKLEARLKAEYGKKRG